MPTPPLDDGLEEGLVDGLTAGLGRVRGAVASVTAFVTTVAAVDGAAADPAADVAVVTAAPEAGVGEVGLGVPPVSYTHLDVYKRQDQDGSRGLHAFSQFAIRNAGPILDHGGLLGQSDTH